MTIASQEEGIGVRTLRYALAIILPPVAVGILDGMGVRLFMSMILTLILPIFCKLSGSPLSN